MLPVTVAAFSAVSAELAGRYTGIHNITGGNGLSHSPLLFSVQSAMTFDPEFSTAHLVGIQIPMHDTRKACMEIPYTLEDGQITFQPSAECYSETKAVYNGTYFSMNWVDLKITYDEAIDEITMHIPSDYLGENGLDGCDWNAALNFTLQKPPELAGAVFEGSSTLNGTQISVTMAFQKDGVVDFSIPQLKLSCPQEPYIATQEGGLWMDLDDDGIPSPDLAMDCLGTTFGNRGIEITSMYFDKELETITLRGSSWQGSSCSSYDCNPWKVVTWVLKRKSFSTLIFKTINWN